MMTFLGILIPILLIAYSSYIIWRSTDGFESAADYLGRHFPNGVKGATLNAVASSMPEFLSTLFFLFYLDDANGFSGGVGITAGSAVFNLLLIPIAILFAIKFWKNKQGIPTDSRIIRRDGLFLLVTNLALIFLLSQSTLTCWHGVVLIAIYLVYLLYIRKDMMGDTEVEDVENDPIANEGTAVKKVFTYDIAGLLFPNQKLTTAKAWTLLLVSVFVLSLGTWLLVFATELLGSKQYSLFGLQLQGLGIPILFVSVILAAAASSIPDTMLSIRDAKKGNFEDSISNALGSNIFDISFALGLPLFLYTTLKGEPIEMSEHVRQLSLSLWIVLFLINLITVPMLMAGRKIGKVKGAVMLGLYILFVLFVVESATKVSEINDAIQSLIGD